MPVKSIPKTFLECLRANEQAQQPKPYQGFRPGARTGTAVIFCMIFAHRAVSAGCLACVSRLFPVKPIQLFYSGMRQAVSHKEGGVWSQRKNTIPGLPGTDFKFVPVVFSKLFR